MRGVSKATLPEIDCREDQRARAEGLGPAHLYPGFSYSLLVLTMVPGQPLSHLLQRGPLVLPLDNFTSCLQTPTRVLREVSSESSLPLPEVGGGRMCTSGHGSGPRSPKPSNADWDAKVFYSINTPSTLGRTGSEASPTLASVLPPPQPSRPSPGVTFEHTHIHTHAQAHTYMSQIHHPPEHFTPRSHHQTYP